MLIINSVVTAEYEAVNMYQTAETSIYVGSEALIGSEHGEAVYGYSNNLEAFVFGRLVGENHGLLFGGESFETSSESVKIYESGRVFGLAEGVALYGVNSTLENAGMIESQIYSAVVLKSAVSSSVSTVTNSGTIIAGTVGAGVYFQGGEDGKLINSGTISGGNSAFNSVNSSADMTVINTGTMYNGILFGAGNDTYVGAGGRVVDGPISPGAGNDRLTGGSTAETFVFATGNDRDTITNFVARGRSHDVLDLSGWDAVETFKDARSHADQHGKDLWIEGQTDDVLILRHVKLNDLNASDFTF